jgi:sugar lactone lactonase YvrE
MYINRFNKISKILILILAFQLITPSYLSAYTLIPNKKPSSYSPSLHTIAKKPSLKHILRKFQQSSNLQLFGPNQDSNPVVNENNQIQLTAMDTSGNPVTGVTFSSGSPDVATVDAQGNVSGKTQGYATITATKGNDTVSIFVTVAKVDSSKGKQASGDTKVDSSGAIYISDPTNNVVFKRASSSSDAQTFAGQMGNKGRLDGDALKSLFSGPTAVAVDNRSQGGIYIADTLNHSIRKVDFNNQVTTVVGTGSPGINTQTTVAISQAVFRSPQGVAVNSAGNIFVADTDNHAIYIVDLSKQEVRLLAGQPGVSGKVDATGSSAKFFRPTALSVQSGSSSFFGSTTSEVLMVADTGNNRIRSITMDGKVTTVGKIQSTSAQPGDFLTADTTPQAASDEFTFNNPRSISVDQLGNIYVVDDSGAKVISQISQQTRIMSSLGQPSVSFGQAMSVVVKANQAFVLDNKATEAQAVKVVTVGQPQIDSLSQNTDILDGGSEIVIKGKNFGPESIVVVGDSLVQDAIIESATSIRLIVPSQNAPGKRTISVQTRGGVDQQEFTVVAPLLKNINDGEITTVAGGIPFLGDGGNAKKANLKFCRSIATDGDGNTYILDSAHNRIRKVDDDGTITSVAGTGSSGDGNDGGPAIATPLDLFPVGGISIDNTGNLIIAETVNNKIRKVDGQTGVITTIAGNGNPAMPNSNAGDGGLATKAELAAPTSTATDSNGNIFIAESKSNRIRRVDAKTGIITTFAGNGRGAFSGDGGPAINASLNNPNKIIFDLKGNLLIADTDNDRIRIIDVKTGIINTIAGNGTRGFSGDGGSALMASLAAPKGLTVAPNGAVLIADTGNNRVRLIDKGMIMTIAGNGMPGPVVEGDLANRVSVGRPEDLDLDGSNNLLIADTANNLIRIVNRNSGIIKTFAGSGEQNFGGDGRLSLFANIDILVDGGAIIDRASNIFFIDQSNQRIRRIDNQTGIITTVAGNGQMGFSGDGGQATNASLNNPKSIAFDQLGNLLIVDSANHRIRRVDQSGVIKTIAGTGQPGFSGDGGAAVNAMLNTPLAIAVTLTNDILISDNNRIRFIDNRTNNIVTFAGTGQVGFSGDNGMAINASFNTIAAIAVDKTGMIYLSDMNNNRIRRIDPRTRIISTIAGNSNMMTPDLGDGGPAINANLMLPTGLDIDIDGSVIFADTLHHRIRKIDVKNGKIKTIVGKKRGFDGDGEPAFAARLNKPTSVVVNLLGDLLISDTDNNALRVVKQFGRIDTLPDFSLDISPENQKVTSGNSASFTVTANGVNNFNGSVDLNAMVSPPNRNVSISFSSKSISPGQSSIVTVSTSADITSTNLSIKVFGNAGPLRRSRNISLSVNKIDNTPTTANFSLSVSPNTQTVKSGSTTSFTVNVTPTGTLSQPVTLSAVVNQPNSNIQITFSPNSLPSGNSTMSVSTNANTPAQNYNIIVTALSGQISQSQTVSLLVTTPVTPKITNASFNKPMLTISGSGFGSSGAVVNVNQQNVSSFISSQTDSQIQLKATKKKLNLKKGSNQVTVTVNGVISNSFTFNF